MDTAARAQHDASARSRLASLSALQRDSAPQADLTDQAARTVRTLGGTVTHATQALAAEAGETAQRMKAAQADSEAASKFLAQQKKQGKMEAQTMDKTLDVAREARKALRNLPRKTQVEALVKKEAGRQLDDHLKQHHAELEQQLERHFKRQDAALIGLGRRLEDLKSSRQGRRGGIPWTLLILGGAGYYVWRNPQLRQKLMGYVEKVSPGAQEKLQSAGEAVQQKIESVRSGSGSGPRPAAQGDQMPDTQTSGMHTQGMQTSGMQTPGMQPTGGMSGGSTSGLQSTVQNHLTTGSGDHTGGQTGGPDLGSRVSGQTQPGSSSTSGTPSTPGKVDPNNRR